MEYSTGKNKNEETADVAATEVCDASLLHILDKLDAVIYVADMQTHELIFANEKLRTDISFTNPVGQKCWQVLQNRQSGPCCFCSNDKLLNPDGTPGKPYTWEFQNTNNGRWYLIKDSAIRWHDGRIVRLEIATDITERKEHEQELQHREEIMRAVNESARLFLQNSRWDANISYVLKLLGKTTNVSRVYIFKNSWDEQGNVRMTHLHEWTNTFVSQEIDNPLLNDILYEDAGAERWKTVFREGKSVFGNINDFPPEEREALGAQGIKSVVAVPLFAMDEWWGFIGFDECRFERSWQESEIQILEAAASIIGSAIHKDRIERELRNSVEEASHASKVKSEFLANMSHEIRTPLNGVLSMIQLMNCTPLSEEQHEYARNAEIAGRSLLTIISDILDITKVEAGTMELDESYFELQNIMQAVMATFSTQARNKGLKLSTSIDENLSPCFLGDSGRIRQILFNVAGNAVKFTEHGEVNVSASAGAERNDGLAELIFTVRDTGIGIPSDKLDTIFDPFTQVDSSYSRNYGGCGLGLGLVRRFTELMGGSATIQSKLGKGTEVVCTLLVRPAERQKAQPVDTPTIPAQRVKLKILVAEDNLVNQIATRKYLEKYGHKVSCTNNGRETLDALQKGNYDCAIIDIQMPIMDGMETIRHIREGIRENIPADLPVIALTAHALKGDKDTFLKAGFDYYLTKPVSMEALQNTIQILASKK